MYPPIELDQDFCLLAQILPWASRQRWFPSNWPTQGWADSYIYSFPTSKILLARPKHGSPWLQLPLVGNADGTVDQNFWSDWLHQAGSEATVLSVTPLGKEQSNSSVELLVSESDKTEKWIGKIFRIVYPGINPDVSIPLELTRNGFSAVAPIRSHYALPLPSGGGEFTSGVVTRYIDNDGTAFDYFTEAARRGRSVRHEAYTIGRLLAELHLALPETDVTVHPDVLQNRLKLAYDEAAEVADGLPSFQELVGHVEPSQGVTRLSVIHGDLHLGQILHSPDGDWTFIDFEGEPLRPLEERNAPDYALRDLAGLLRSVDYAGAGDVTWVDETQAACVSGFASAASADLDPSANAALLELLQIEKALYEVKYEAMFRPDYLRIPLSALQR